MIIKIKKFIESADKKIDFKKFIKYGITGVINTGVDWLAFTLLREIFGFEARFAQVIAHALAIINSYIINKNWAFKNKNAGRGVPPYKEILKFLIVQGTSLCLGYAGMFFLHDKLELNEYLCKVPIACATVLINYLYLNEV